MSASFVPKLPDLLSAGWGPTDESTPTFSGLPFTPFSKRDSINYVANWDENRRPQRTRTKFGDDSAHLAGLKEDVEEGDDFTGGITIKKKSYETIAKYRRDRTGQQNKLKYSQKKVAIAEQQRLQNAPVSRKGTRRQVQNKRRRKKYIENPRPVKPSILKNEAWVDLHDIWFRESFERNNIKSYTFKIDGEEIHNMVYVPRRKELLSAGTLHGVLTRFDSRAGNSYRAEPLNYEKFSDFKYLNFNFKSAIQDPYILELANNNNTGANIYTTDNVMSAIMCCNRSKYSFDIVINKVGDKIFLDERNRVLSSYSVDETSQNRPTRKGTSKINTWTSLASEATYINHVFKEQMVFHQNLEHRQKFKRQHPFLSEINGGNDNNQSSGKGKKGKKNKQVKFRQPTDQQPAAQAFTYNKYKVTDNIQVVVRCAIDGYIVDPRNPRSKSKDWCQIFALNQYDSNRSKTQNWGKYLETRDSTILSQEITNNNFKCARWGIKAHLSGSKYLKIGYVTRANVHSTEKHLINGVKTYETGDFIKNRLRMRSLNDPWTIFAKFMKSIFELKDDGRYVAIRDPLKQVIRLYRTKDEDFFKDDGLPTYQSLKKWVKVPKKSRKGQNNNDNNVDFDIDL